MHGAVLWLLIPLLRRSAIRDSPDCAVACRTPPADAQTTTSFLDPFAAKAFRQFHRARRLCELSLVLATYPYRRGNGGRR